jgi:hypothetical protein
MNDYHALQAIRTIPAIRKFLDADVLEHLKSIETYDRQLWAYALDLYRGGDAGYFIDDYATAISNQLSRAWNEGAREVKVNPEDMDETDHLELQSIIDNEYEHVLDLATDIQNAQTLTLDEFRRQFRNRITLWVNRYKDVKDRAKIYFGGKTRLVWVLGKTEKHCASCSALNGIVAWAKEWEEAGVKPQNPPNAALECGGWNCDCSLEVTERRRSANALARILRVINL